jgi:DNA (cytosine-5)-methyltransferase 1
MRHRGFNVDTTKKPPTILSLCTGYGGIERGLEAVFGELSILAHVEIEAFAIANLVNKMETGQMVPAPIWTDLKTFDAKPFREAIDILTGGYPCQPFSVSGKRKGADDPRHLWPYIRSAIFHGRPGQVFLENVEGHITKGIAEVLEDLERMEYKIEVGIFSADELGATHRRKRVFILANSDDSRRQQPRAPLWARNNNIDVEAETRALVDPKSRRLQTRPMDIEHLQEGERQRGEATNHKPKVKESSRLLWPAGPGAPQFEWENPRAVKSRMDGTTNGPPNRVDRLRLLGNGVVPQTAAKAYLTLSDKLTSQKLQS